MLATKKNPYEVVEVTGNLLGSPDEAFGSISWKSKGTSTTLSHPFIVSLMARKWFTQDVQASSKPFKVHAW
jgi:hypothetical protein